MQDSGWRKMKKGKWKLENGNGLSISPVSIFHFQISSFLLPESRILNPALDAGVALLAVMSAITVLILVAMAFSGSVQLETRTAIYRKEATQAYALAMGGIQAALLEIAYPPANDQEDKPRSWIEGQRSAQVSYAGGKALVEIVNETGKLDMNSAGREQLGRLLEARGLAPNDAQQLAAAIKHWRSPAAPDDPDSEALDQYYRGAGYSPTHLPFASLEEVLRVRGMSRDIFYGTAVVSREGRIQSQYGVDQDLTIYSGSSQVNVNYASEAVLRSLPDFNAQLAQAIVQERKKQPFKSLDDIAQRLAVSVPDQAVPYLNTDTCDIYSIVAVGEVNGSRVRRTVKAVVQLTRQDVTQHHRILAWYDDVTD
jgi:general secretion pathway protein K